MTTKIGIIIFLQLLSILIQKYLWIGVYLFSRKSKVYGEKMSKKYFVLLLAILCCLVSCNKNTPISDSDSSNESSSSVISNTSINEGNGTIKEYCSVRQGKNVFLIAGNNIYVQSKDAEDKKLVVSESTEIKDMILHDNKLYYAVILEDVQFECDNFKIFSVNTDGTGKECVMHSLSFAELKEQPLLSWTIYNGKIYIQSNFAFFELDISTKQIEKLHNDVARYQFHDNDLYFVDHANRTFTIYKMNLDTKIIEIVLGDGDYDPDKTNEEEKFSNFVITEDGSLIYAKRNPYGLYDHDNNDLLIEAGENIYEYSLAHWGNVVYYVIKEDRFTLVKYDVTTEEKQCVNIDDFKDFASITENGYYYENTSGECVKINI